MSIHYSDEFPRGVFFHEFEENLVWKRGGEATVTHREVKSIACPKCEALRGNGCHTDTGWRARLHAQRIAAAELAKADGSLGSGVIHPESHHPAGTEPKSYHPRYVGRVTHTGTGILAAARLDAVA